MAIDGQIKNKKTTTKQYDIDREAAKTSALPSGKINQYEYFTGEEILVIIILLWEKLLKNKQKNELKL